MAEPKKGRTDSFANIAFGTLTMSAADTLTFALIQMAVGLFQGVAMLINRIRYYPTAGTMRMLVAAADSLTIGLTSSSRLTSLADVTDPAVLDLRRLVCIGAATAICELPIVSDYSQMPGGGKLVSANPLYLGMSGESMTGAGTVRAQIDFTFLQLSPQDYLELIQAQYPASIS